MKKQSLQDLSLLELGLLEKRFSYAVINAETFLGHVKDAWKRGPYMEPPPSQKDIYEAQVSLERNRPRLTQISIEMDTRLDALFEPTPVVDTSADKREKAMWLNLLGFTPEMIRHTDDHNNCLNCNSTALRHVNSPPWTSIHQCTTCGYFTYIVHQDRMGTVMPDDVALDMRESTMIPRKSSTET